MGVSTRMWIRFETYYTATTKCVSTPFKSTCHNKRLRQPFSNKCRRSDVKSPVDEWKPK